jgi:hypothetical protein
MARKLYFGIKIGLQKSCVRWRRGGIIVKLWFSCLKIHMNIFKFFKRKSQRSFFDIILTASAVVMFWYGVWGLTEIYLFPSHPAVSYLIAIALGLFILWVDDEEITELHSGRK